MNPAMARLSWAAPTNPCPALKSAAQIGIPLRTPLMPSQLRPRVPLQSQQVQQVRQHLRVPLQELPQRRLVQA